VQNLPDIHSLCWTHQDILRTNGVVDKRLDVWQRAVDTQRFNPKCALL
jgi:hypothetical protein